MRENINFFSSYPDPHCYGIMWDYAGLVCHHCTLPTLYPRVLLHESLDRVRGIPHVHEQQLRGQCLQ